MKIMIILCLMSMLVGCDTIDSSWKHAPREYICTTEQMEKALKETKEAISIDQGHYYPAYWYGNAIIRNCEKMK